MDITTRGFSGIIDNSNIVDGSITYSKLSSDAKINVPVGSIIAWLKTYTNTPALPSTFVECNGQVISDALSVYDGQTIPNLNGNAQFLYGAAASGGTKSENYLPSHKHDLSVDNTANGRLNTAAGAFNADSDQIATTTSGAAWAGYAVVWVMRVK